MNKSESIVKISAASVKAQRKMGAAAKGSANPFFKSKYSDLGAVMEACKEALNDEGISVSQPVNSDATGDYVDTYFIHDSGEYFSSRMRLLPFKNMQEFGSAISYAKRYSLQSMGFIPSADDDGEASLGRGKTPTKDITGTQLKAVEPATPTNQVAPTVNAQVDSAAKPNWRVTAAQAKRNADVKATSGGDDVTFE